MNFWLRVEKFLNLKIPKKFSIIPFLSNILYFSLFVYLVFLFNPYKRKKHYFLLILFFLISYPFPYLAIVSMLSLSHNGDFLRHFYLNIFNNFFILHLFEIITYLIFYFPYSYVCSFLQKTFRFYLIKKVKQKLGRLNPENKFGFLTNFDYDRYYKFACQRKLYSRYFDINNWHQYDQIVENIIKWINNISWHSQGYLPRYYSHIILEVFLFNSDNSNNSESKINPKKWKYFLIFYFIFTALHFIFTWYPLWLVAGYYYWDQLNVNLYKELFESDVAFWGLPFLFLYIAYVIIPMVLYFPKTWLTFWLFEG